MSMEQEIQVAVRPGEVLAGKYRVERVLGAGGMGVVVAAHHIQLDQKVALKFLLPQALGNPEAVARFVREARAAVKIQSEHVARVSDVGQLENGAPYMVMEFLQGGDLAQWLKQNGPLPFDQAADFVLQACVAVADAHALGIVHRDLKPANLFCVRRSDGQLTIKVLDFGISKSTSLGSSGPGMDLTKTSALMGTPLYMSPEQMRSSRDVDGTTDIWALGVILFELIAGKPPFYADSITELVMKVGNDPPQPLRTFRPDAPGGLDAVIGKCLEKDRTRRYRNIGELAVALLPFAPKRAKASVERISGILQAAGLSESALAVPVSPPAGGTQVSAGTLPPVGRTTVGQGRVGSKTLGLVGAGAVVVAGAIAGVVVLGRRSDVAKGAVQAAASQVPSAALTAPSGSGTSPPEVAQSTPVPSPVSSPAPSVTPPPVTAAPSAATPVQGNAKPASGARAQIGPVAQSSKAVALPPPATAPSCHVVTEYDSKGDPHYKKVCN
jgi:serine/threonine-protein kinase